jgi:DNA-binding GntR family transcriptional regulator
VAALAEHYGVSKATVTRTLRILAGEGLVRVLAGEGRVTVARNWGAFVAER